MLEAEATSQCRRGLRMGPALWSSPPPLRTTSGRGDSHPLSSPTTAAGTEAPYEELSPHGRLINPVEPARPVGPTAEVEESLDGHAAHHRIPCPRHREDLCRAGRARCTDTGTVVELCRGDVLLVSLGVAGVRYLLGGRAALERAGAVSRVWPGMPVRPYPFSLLAFPLSPLHLAGLSPERTKDASCLHATRSSPSPMVLGCALCPR